MDNEQANDFSQEIAHLSRLVREAYERSSPEVKKAFNEGIKSMREAIKRL